MNYQICTTCTQPQPDLLHSLHFLWLGLDLHSLQVHKLLKFTSTYSGLSIVYNSDYELPDLYYMYPTSTRSSSLTTFLVAGT
mmetsp:Transcript_9704/g.15924  ORF Transcript_9704/g.15924 Transcript_9704/m.15924 type:complete len:82 (-) Transcript_9704:21-266(-)